MSHPEPDRLLDMALDLLDGEELLALRGHLDACATCAAQLTELEGEQQALRGAFAPGVEDAAADERARALEDRVLSALRSSPVARARARRRLLRWSVAAAAACLVAVTTIFLTRSSPKQELLTQLRRSEMRALEPQGAGR